jgi:hypothetical protein
MRTRALAVTACLLALGGAASAQWQSDPALGARRDAYGPGAHTDATGRLYRDRADFGGRVLDPVVPNAYGPGIGMDGTGRAVRPDYGRRSAFGVDDE